MSHDSDDDSDSDYVEGLSDAEDDETNVNKEKGLQEISTFRKRKIESIFDEMVSSDETEVKLQRQKATIAVRSVSRKTEKIIQTKKKASKVHQTPFFVKILLKVSLFKKCSNMQVLSSIFGKTDALKILSKSVLVKEFPSSTPEATVDESDFKQLLKKSVQSVSKKQKVIENRKFAGETIRFVFI